MTFASVRGRGRSTASKSDSRSINLVIIWLLFVCHKEKRFVTVCPGRVYIWMIDFGNDGLSHPPSKNQSIPPSISGLAATTQLASTLTPHALCTCTADLNCQLSSVKLTRGKSAPNNRFKPCRNTVLGQQSPSELPSITAHINQSAPQSGKVHRAVHTNSGRRPATHSQAAAAVPRLPLQKPNSPNHQTRRVANLSSTPANSVIF